MKAGFPFTKLHGATLLATCTIWVLVAGSATWWTFKLLAGMPTPLKVAADAPALQADAQQVKRLLGASGAKPSRPAPARPRLVLQGVIGDAGKGRIAVIEVEDQAARPYLVGREVVPGYTLRTVDTREATLATQDGGDLHLAMPDVQAPRPEPAIKAKPPTAKRGAR
jgi:hypothetical protein